MNDATFVKAKPTEKHTIQETCQHCNGLGWIKVQDPAFCGKCQKPKDTEGNNLCHECFREYICLMEAYTKR